MEVYDNFAPYYDAFKREDDYRMLYSILKEIRKPYMSLSTSLVAWDIGTGTGAIARMLNEDGFNTVGSDLSPAMIRQAKRQSPRIRYLISDIRAGGIGCDCVDLAVAIDDVFNCLTTCKELRQALSHVASSLKKGGLLQFDLVCDSGFQSYMSEVRYRDYERIKFLTYPLNNISEYSHDSYSMGCIVLALSGNGDYWEKREYVFTEYPFPPAMVEEALCDVGLSIITRHVLTIGGSVAKCSLDSLPDYSSKILYLCKKGGG